MTPEELQQLNELVQELHATLRWGPHAVAGYHLGERHCELVVLALEELARLRVELAVYKDNSVAPYCRPNTRT